MDQVLSRNCESKNAKDKEDKIGLDAAQNEFEDRDKLAHTLEDSKRE